MKNVSVGITLLILSGCGAVEEPSNDTFPVTSDQVRVAPQEPVPVAEAVLPSGQKISFYEIDGRGVITERGPASMRPILSSLDRETMPTFTELFSTLRPDLAVPTALQELQARIDERAASVAAPDLLPTRPAGGSRAAPLSPAVDGARTVSSFSPNDVSKKQSYVLEGCTNGCCDRAWVFDQPCWLTGSPDGPSSDVYFLFNIMSSSIHAWGLDWANSVVCAAVGPSFHVVNSSTWHVSEATYHVFHWDTGSCPWYNPWCDFTGDFKSNFTDYQALHTHCAYFAW